MKKILLPILFAMLALSSFSQKRCKDPDCKTDFLKNKLYVVETENAYFDSALKANLATQWTASPIAGYISKKEFKHLRKSTDNSFLDPETYTWTDRSNMNGGRAATGLFFFRGDTYYPVLEPNVQSYELVGDYTGEGFDSCVYRLELMVRVRNNYYLYGNTADSGKVKYGMPALKKKILLINQMFVNNKKKRMDCFTQDAFADYPYKVEFASSAKIAELIRTKNKQYALAVPIVNDVTRKVFIYDLETSAMMGGFERSGMLALPIRAKDVDDLVDKIHGL